MKVLHIVPGLDPDSGGPRRSIIGICRALVQAGVGTTLFTHSPRYPMPNPSGVSYVAGKGVRLNQLYPDLVHVLDRVQPKLIHLHGLWMPSSHLAFRLAQKRNIPVILSIRGGLTPWALRQKRIKKKLAMWLYQRRDLTTAAAFHATSDSEAETIRVQKLTQPIWVIPNGVDLPDRLPERKSAGRELRTAIFLSRLHPGKGLLGLAQAWACVRPRGWRMRVVGPDVCGHKAEVKAEIARLGLEKEFEFVDEMDDQAKWQEYVNADLFILPSHSENFGISIAEALAAGLPVITTKGTPWSELLGNSDGSIVGKSETAEVEPRNARSTRNEGEAGERKDNQQPAIGNCSTNALMHSRTNELPPMNSRTHELVRSGRAGWWIDIGVDPLVKALEEAISLTDEERCAMGANGRQLIDAKYTWPSIGKQMKQAYERLLEGYSKHEDIS